ncbi:MAG: hypothetical protein JWN86_4638 [Planctomycetota bacterium]|nr:hypothetical protein [Planctomycetota bacterium]
MASPVDVSSIDVLRAVREAFLLFADDSRNALGSMESEIRRAIDWLTHDQRLYWQAEVKRRTEKLSSAKAELSRKQLGIAPGQQAHDSEQREAVREAKHRLEEAQEKVENVNRWLPVVERAVMEYESQARPFSDMIEFDVERSVEMLDRMIVALDEYLRLTPPETAAPQPSLVSSTVAVSSSPPDRVAVAKTEDTPTAEDDTKLQAEQS